VEESIIRGVPLSSTQIEQYWKTGFVLIPGLFEPRDIERWEARFLDLVLGRVPPPKSTIIMRDVMIARGVVVPATTLHGVNKLLSFEDDPVLFEYALDGRLIAAVQALIGDELDTISTNVFNKPPGVDGRHPIHQDLRYFTLRPADGIIACWTAISRCSRENGCLAVIPGSHKGELLRHGKPDWEHVNFGFDAAETSDLDRREHVEMEPGDTLLFHPLLLHGSGKNRSSGFRRAICTHYASSQCLRPSGKRKRETVMRRVASAD
jgi:phytanoyl-CoA hydroxylase